MPIRAQLPNELFSIIISELASDTENISRTRASLASCRLASHVLCSLTTPLFFSSIELKENVRVNSNNNLVAFLERARNLYQLLSIHDVAASVHTFTLCCGQYVLGYAIIGTLISTIFYRLPHIRNFTFKNTVERCSLSFSSIPRDLSSAIQALCKSPNLTMLDLNSINSFPITAITASPNLRCLRLSHTKLYFDDVNSIDETSSLQPFYLDSLVINSDSVSSLSSGISRNKPFAEYLSRLKNLQLDNFFAENERLKFGWDIILRASQSLTTLGFPRDRQLELTDLSPSFDDFPFNLGRFPALRHFNIQLPISFKDNLPMLSFLNQLLSISSSTSGIETLEIKITWSDAKNEQVLKDLFSSGAEWSTFDEVLTSEKFVSLRKVVLDLRLKMDDDHRNLEYRDLTLSYVNVLFPMFRALTSGRGQRTLETHIKIN